MSSVSPNTFNLDEYYKEELERSQGNRQTDKDSKNKQFDTNEQTIKENYTGKIEDAKEEYEHLFRENAVQKLINERQIAENMANLGLTDSGLNRTQMTANQLSYANNNAEYSRQRQKAVDKLNTTMNQYLTQNEIDRNAAINKIDKDYDDKAYSDAVSRYTTDVEAENDRIKAEIDAETDRINAQISANTAAEKNRTSALNSLHTKLMDGNLTEEQKIALIKNANLQVGIYEDELPILAALSGIAEEQLRIIFGLPAAFKTSTTVSTANENPIKHAINNTKNLIPPSQQVKENINSGINKNSATAQKTNTRVMRKGWK